MAKKVAGKTTENKTVGTSFLKRNLYPVIVFAFSFLLFANSIPNDYNMDDEIVTRNHRLTSQGISAIPKIFTSSYYQDDMGYAYEYRPLVLTTFAIEHQFLGQSPHVGHFINVILYAITCLLLYQLLTHLSPVFGTFFSLVIVLLFASHTSHTEVVSSIKNRDEILGLLFCLLALIMGVKSVRNSQPFLFVLLAVFYVLALLSKITFFPFAFIIIATLAWFTEIKLVRLLLISLLLAIPAFILLPVAHVVTKLFMTLALPFSSLFIYGLLNINFKPERFKQRLHLMGNSVRSALAAQTSLPDTPTANANDFKWNKLISESWPAAGYFSLRAILFPLILSGIYAAGFYFWHPVISTLALCALLLLGLSKNEKLVWWARMMLYLCIVLFPRAVYLNENFLPLTISVVLWLVIHDVFQKRQFYLPALLLAVLFFIHLWVVILFYYTPFPPKNDPMILGVMALFAYVYTSWQFLYKKKRAMGGIAVLILLGNISLSLFALSPIWSPWFILIFLVMWVLYKQPKSIPYTLWLGKVCIVAVMIFQQETAPPITIDYKTGINNTVDRIEKVAGENKTNLLPENQDRPIGFVEQPVSPNDSWQIRTGTSLQVMFHYLTKTILPYPLAFYYGYSFITPQKISEPVPLISLFIHLFLILSALYFFRRYPMISWGLGIYLISAVTFSNFFLPVPGIVGDRYLLIPTLGWSILLTWAVFKIWRVNTDTGKLTLAHAPKGLKYTLAAIISLYSILTFARNFDWKDDLTLMRKDLLYVSQSAQGHNLLALHLMQHAQKEQNPSQQTELQKEALVHFEKALEIYPPFFNAAFDIGRTFAALNLPDSALTYFIRASQIDSTYPISHQFISELLINMKRYKEAVPYAEYFMRKAPADYDGYAKLSYIYFVQADYQRSLSINRLAAAKLPGNINPLINLAQTFRTLQQTDSALHYLNLARQIDPNNGTVNQAINEINR